MIDLAQPAYEQPLTLATMLSLAKPATSGSSVCSATLAAASAGRWPMPVRC